MSVVPSHVHLPVTVLLIKSCYVVFRFIVTHCLYYVCILILGQTGNGSVSFTRSFLLTFGFTDPIYLGKPC